MHQKHSNISRAKFGTFARNEMAVLGTPCDQIKILFDKIIARFPQKNIAVVEADHQAEGNILAFSKWTDKINFQRFETKNNFNDFEKRMFFENTDLTLINGNHFVGKCQIIVIDDKKPLEKKLSKLTDVALVIQKSDQIPGYILDHLGDNHPPIVGWEDDEAIFNFISDYFMNRIPPLFGLVLSGGKSSRMGMDKGTLRYHNQLPQIQHCFNLLQKYCGENVYLSVSNEQYQDLNLPIIKDSFLEIGPTGGILSALKQHPNAAWLVVACDMPFINENTLKKLVANRNSSKIATAFQSPNEEFPEPLITIWEPRAYPKLLTMLAYGYDCPRKTLINSDIELIKVDDPAELQNINTKEEYERAIIDLSPKIV
ncbi:MAG: NTP transferase domain-containing protein [Bacteroidota bacterium]